MTSNIMIGQNIYARNNKINNKVWCITKHNKQPTLTDRSTKNQNLHE